MDIYTYKTIKILLSHICSLHHWIIIRCIIIYENIAKFLLCSPKDLKKGYKGVPKKVFLMRSQQARVAYQSCRVRSQDTMVKK